MPLYPGAFSQLHTKDQGEKTPTGSSQATGEGEDPRGQGMDAPGWSGSASLCSLLWRNRSLSLHRTAPPSQAFSLTTLLLFWILHQQALVGRQYTGFSELSWLTSSHLGEWVFMLFVPSTILAASVTQHASHWIGGGLF